jgi:hypothetical protein
MITIEPERTLSPPLLSASRHELVQRVLASSLFVKSKRLSAFLEYVCNLALAGREDEINEQSIGEAVFGRPRDYDSTIDGIVRTQASRLRQRLELYFSEEGIDEPILIVIPRGGYVPVFERRSSEQKISDSQSFFAESTLPPSRENIPRAPISPMRRGALAWFLVAALAVALVALIWRDQKSRTATSAVPISDHIFWSQIFTPGNPTILVPGDSSLVIWQSLRERNIDLTEYVTGSYRTPSPTAGLTPENIAARVANARYTSIVDLEIAESLGLIGSSRRSSLEIRYPRELRPNDMKQGNLVFVGISEANPWVTLFERDMNFVFLNNREKHLLSLFNRSPRANEPSRWDVPEQDRQHRVYAVVAFLPNLAGNGNVLILEGTTMAGTECAWDFVSDDSRLLPFLQKIRQANGRIPYFEVVLGTNNISGSAVASSILSFRVRP